MASIYDLKPAFQAVLRPLVRRLAARGVTANQVTLAACALSIIVGAMISAVAASRPGILLLLPVVMIVRMALNAIDGMLAREHAMKSALGGFLNEITDVVSDAALYLPLAVLPAANAPLVVLFVLLAVIAEMTGVVAAAQGGSRRYDGPMGKSDRAVVIGALGLVIGMGVDIGGWTNLLLIVLSGLLCMTIYNRVRGGLQETRG
jgi:CDP-diacylglycerol---glycerol-3-phosphate 3-phosphatidyltransferase